MLYQNLCYSKVCYSKDCTVAFFYHLPNILIVLGTLPDKRCLSHGMCLYQVMMTLHFLNDVSNDAESTPKSKIASLSLV